MIQGDKEEKWIKNNWDIAAFIAEKNEYYLQKESDVEDSTTGADKNKQKATQKKWVFKNNSQNKKPTKIHRFDESRMAKKI